MSEYSSVSFSSKADGVGGSLVALGYRRNGAMLLGLDCPLRCPVDGRIVVYCDVF
jgi:hypothetical protein